MDNLIDIGVNLMHKSFHGDREEVITRALESGVSQMIITGTSLRSSQEALRFAKTRAGVLYSTAGVHPHDAKNFNKGALGALRELAADKEVAAIGECGLDFNRDFSPRDAQEKCFEEQLDLARQVKKPLFLHERDAHKRFIEIMQQHKDLIARSVVHCFTGNEYEVKDYVELGFMIGVTGWVCDERRGKDLRKALRHVPLDRLMIETDAPFLTPRDLNPKPKDGRNEPAFLTQIAKAAASCMGLPAEKVAEASTQNAIKFFGLAIK